MSKIINESGYSLVEMIMALALFGFIFSTGCYVFNRVIPKYRLDGAVNSLVSDFHWARMRAIGQNCTYRIQVDCGRKQYLLERELLTGSSRWPGVREGLLRKFNDPGNPFYYPGVEMESSNNPVFLPRGNVVGTTIVLKNSSGQKKITLSSQGRVKVQEG